MHTTLSLEGETMQVHDLLEILQSFPEDSAVDIIVCFGDGDTNLAQSEVAYCESVCASVDGVDSLSANTGRVALRGYYSPQIRLNLVEEQA
jgi:hypothetical protein